MTPIKQNSDKLSPVFECLWQWEIEEGYEELGMISDALNWDLFGEEVYGWMLIHIPPR